MEEENTKDLKKAIGIAESKIDTILSKLAEDFKIYGISISIETINYFSDKEHKNIASRVHATINFLT